MQQPFSGNDSPSFLTTINRYKVIGSFVTFGFQVVNIMYITEKCEYVFVQNQQKKSSAPSLW